MPTGGENIGQEDEIGFVFRAVGEGEAVEICVWDAEELGLAALVGPHCYVAVRPARETSSVTKELASSFVGS